MKSGDDGLKRTTIRDQGRYDDHPIRRTVQAEKGCTDRGGKGLTAYFALVTCFFAAVNNNGVLASFAPCGAGYIRAELLSRVHVACSSKVVEPLECHRTFIFFNLHSWVECYRVLVPPPYMADISLLTARYSKCDIVKNPHKHYMWGFISVIPLYLGNPRGTRTLNPLIKRRTIFRLPGISGATGVTGVYIWRVFSLPTLLKVTRIYSNCTQIARRNGSWGGGSLAG
jgi:hypothetical protein